MLSAAAERPRSYHSQGNLFPAKVTWRLGTSSRKGRPSNKDLDILKPAYIKSFRSDPEELGSPRGKQYKPASCMFPNDSKMLVLSDKALNYLRTSIS